MERHPQSQVEASHVFEEHTGEVLVRLRAPTLDALLVEAGRALAELLAGEPPGALEPAEQVTVRAPDRGALLVEWINELIFLSETRKRVYAGFQVEAASEREARAEVRGWPASLLRTQVKAATFHRLSITDEPGGLQAQVVLDV